MHPTLAGCGPVPAAFPSEKVPRGENTYKMRSDWEFYEPPERCAPVEFCLDTSLHGLHYIGQRKRHLFERIFWMTAFAAAVIAASLLISELFSNYSNDPVQTVFTGKEMPIADIPFPAVTICNVNNMKRSKMLEYKEKAETLIELEKRALHHREPFNVTALMVAYAAMIDVINICSTETFSKRIVKKGKHSWGNLFDKILNAGFENRTDEYEEYHHITQVLIDGSQSCSDMILFCMWLDEITDCAQWFQEIETDYGYCCTFNTIPLTLLEKYFNDSRDSAERVEDWQEADLSYDNLLFTKETKQRKCPLRQKYPGRSAGLTVLLDPDIKEYFCTNTDSEGFVLGVNGPLDFPRMKDNGFLVKTDAEVYINVRPEITMSDDSIRKFELEKRNCLFGTEKTLPHYTKYTASNCLDECIAHRTMEQCHCVRYYMPRSHEDPLCKPSQYSCADEVRKNIIQQGFGEACHGCLPTCTEIEYRTEVTALNIRRTYMDRIFHAYPELKTKSQNVSIVHVYFGVDTTYPRMRKEVYSIIDLISNTGGLLGLCMGFSMLSLLEILYYCSIRLCFRFRRKHLKKSGAGLNQEEQEATAIIFKQPNDIKQKWFSAMFSRSDDTISAKKEDGQNGIFNIIHGPNQISSPTLPAYYRSEYRRSFGKAKD